VGPASSRRRFLEALAWAGGAAFGGARADAAAGDAGGPPTARGDDPPGPRPATSPGPGFFSAEERGALAALADHVLPNAARWGAVEYVEQLLTAFDHDPPRIHAGGPYSGRHPFATRGRPGDEYPPDDFAAFLPLDRVQERAWRLRLFGSQAVDHPNAAVLGPVTGLRPLLLAGAREAARLAGEGRPAGRIWSRLSEEFRSAFTELVVEASLGDPVYGGNRGGEGWRAFHFEGDSMPLGYSLYDAEAGAYRERPEAPLTTLEPGPGPEPLGVWTRLVLSVFAFLSRRAEL
jgi:hypothetical protein